MYPTEYITNGIGWNGVPEQITQVITKPNGTKEYQVSDHLASLRVAIEGGTARHIDYDPWGTPSGVVAGERQTFNAQERDRESGLFDLSDRKLDPVIGGFTGPDRLWEEERSLSPYVYCANNPLRLTDPGGMQAAEVYNDGGGDADDGSDGHGSEHELVHNGDPNGHDKGHGRDGTTHHDDSHHGDSQGAHGDDHAGSDHGGYHAAELDHGGHDDPASAPLIDYHKLLKWNVTMGDCFEFVVPSGPDANYSEHKKGKRKSTKGKHEEGERRRKARENDKKRNRPGWQQNPNRDPNKPKKRKG